ncbi:hypothetical protein ACI3EY_17035 [Ornithinimicrobium sp. LYQ92]|uniref:hypothetical protein n=1 Tax=Serinicoccus sp. LYQ92 TaxID=3378798 RepID=UPI003852983F
MQIKRIVPTAFSMALVASAMAAPASASIRGEHSDGEGITAEEFHDAIADYRLENPQDIEGLESLVVSLGGDVSISTSASGPTDGRTANADMRNDPSEMGALDFPTDAFVVSIVSASHPASTTADISGHWNWRDDFVGQGAPVDIAALQLSSGCGQFLSHSSATYTYDGTSTNRGTLRESGVGTNSPTWNIDDAVSNFTNYADNGVVAVTYDKSDCSGVVQAAFTYEGNNGGSLTGVSVGWGIMNVTYNSPNLFLQKSSSPTTI